MALFKKRTAGKPGEWYYCLEHKKVEEGPDCPAKNRFGPYATREEASHAMETAPPKYPAKPRAMPATRPTTAMLIPDPFPSPPEP
ncbi:hypothetical protein, partial [Streptomyces sp. NPDC001919]